MITVCDSDRNLIGNITRAIKANVVTELNGENTLTFSAILEEGTLINKNSIFLVDGQYYDIAEYVKTMTQDGYYTIDVDAEHVSYRLNKSMYDITTPFDYTGTPTYILENILHRTDFSLGVVEFTDDLEYYVEEKNSRRKLLMDFVNILEGEIIFDNFTVNLYKKVGSETIKTILPDSRIRTISQTVDNRTPDDTGNPTVSYDVEPEDFSSESYSLGDSVYISDKQIGVQDILRVLSVEKDAYDGRNTKLKFGKITKGLDREIYDIDNKAGKNTGLPPPILDPRSMVSLSPVWVTVRNHPSYPGVPIMLIIYSVERDTASAQFVYGGYNFQIDETSIVYAFYEWEGELSLVRMEQYNNTILLIDNIDITIGVSSTLYTSNSDEWVVITQLPKEAQDFTDGVDILQGVNSELSLSSSDDWSVVINKT
jgi:hypothetical protein